MSPPTYTEQTLQYTGRGQDKCWFCLEEAQETDKRVWLAHSKDSAGYPQHALHKECLKTMIRKTASIFSYYYTCSICSKKINVKSLLTYSERFAGSLHKVKSLAKKAGPFSLAKKAGRFAQCFLPAFSFIVANNNLTVDIFKIGKNNIFFKSQPLSHDILFV